jgi:hypothetical protein
MQTIKTYDFIILCNQTEESRNTRFCLERISKLKNENNRLRVILVPVGDQAKYFRGAKFKAVTEEFSASLDIHILKETTMYATEPRGYNYGLFYCLQNNPADYFIFLHDYDYITDNQLLDYYNWLFSSASYPDLVGAVTFSTNITKKEATLTKMMYVDDIFLRGSCFTKEAILAGGPFDESLTYRTFEFDFSSRIVHHGGYLIRAGKEGNFKVNNYIKLGGPHLTTEYEKVAFLNKQSLVLLAKKWHNKGTWQDMEPKTPNCFIQGDSFSAGYSSGNFSEFKKLFKTSPSARTARFDTIFRDNIMMRGFEATPGFVKSPLGNFIQQINQYSAGPEIMNKPEIQTYVHNKMTFNDLLWDAEKKL